VSNLWQIHHLLLPTPTTQDGANNGGPSQFERNTLPLNAEVMLLPVTTADNGWCEQCWMDYDSSTCLCDEFGYIQDQDTSELMLLPTPSTRDGKGATSSRSGDNKHDLPSALADPDLTGPLRAQGKADVTGKPPTLGPVSQISWGKYEPAIRRWEQIVGPAPAPTEPNKNDNPRLSAAFSEWLMGWPAGWVTDPDIGISRNDQLRIVGNGVCSQQAAAALRQLLVVAS
jgi:DNA (cytosine-5)-methyltransferase 1